jgi:sugar lactone lactonase YvrE
MDTEKNIIDSAYFASSALKRISKFQFSRTAVAKSRRSQAIDCDFAWERQSPDWPTLVANQRYQRLLS